MQTEYTNATYPLNSQNNFFYKYKDDLTAATNLALKGDKEELQRHCANQVSKCSLPFLFYSKPCFDLLIYNLGGESYGIME